MEEIKYNKLVRDRIPEIIQADGKKCVTRILAENEYVSMLDRKIDEELKEFRADYSIEELADLLEVIYAMANAKGYSIDQLEKVRCDKSEARGGFEKRIFLESVIQ